VPERFPLTERAFQAFARRLGYVGGGSRRFINGSALQMTQ
jgi:hypothetical protein